MAPDKRAALLEAAKLVPDRGCRLALGGVTMYRRPVAFVMALVSRYRSQQTPHRLELLCFTAGIESDLLVGAGMVSSVRTCYFGLEAFGLAPHFTSAAGQGDLQVIEESEASIASGLRATLAGVGFMPALAWQGTDMLKLRPDVKTIEDPYSGESLTAFPALDCDVAVIHALTADPEGNALIGGNQGVDFELALVAETVILTAEAVVPRLERADIVAPAVDVVVEAPSGAWPTSCHPNYPLDGEAVISYLERTSEREFASLLAEWAQRHGLSSADWASL